MLPLNCSILSPGMNIEIVNVLISCVNWCVMCILVQTFCKELIYKYTYYIYIYTYMIGILYITANLYCICVSECFMFA